MKKNFKLFSDKNSLLKIKSNKKSLDYIKNFYKNSFYQKSFGQYEKNYSKAEINAILVRDKIYHHFIKKSKKRVKKILDIGCGEGFTTNFFLKKNYDCYAADFSIHGISSQNKPILSKIKFYQGDILEDNYFEKIKFDAIVANGILEHVIDPQKFILKMREKLKKKGMLFINVPNEYNTIQNEYMKLNSIKKKTKVPWYSPPVHLSYFSKESLIKTLHKNGFRVKEILSDYPIDQFLLSKQSDYYKNKKFGKIAYSIRVNFTNLASKNLENYINYSKALLNLGFGRNLISYFEKK